MAAVVHGTQPAGQVNPDHLPIPCGGPPQPGTLWESAAMLAGQTYPTRVFTGPRPADAKLPEEHEAQLRNTALCITDHKLRWQVRGDKD